MRVTAVFFARLRREFGIDRLELEVPEPATVRHLAILLEQEHGVSLRGCMVAVNETYADPNTTLKNGDEVAFLPPVAGGQSEDDAAPERFHLDVTTQRLDLARADAFLVQPAYGAQAYFVGTVRSPNHGKVVQYIEYEGFAPMARNVMRAAAERAEAEHGPLRVFIEHRVGRLEPGEASILIGVASAHRRAALNACSDLIEHLKLHVPVWKREVDESGEHWVEGQTPHPAL